MRVQTSKSNFSQKVSECGKSQFGLLVCVEGGGDGDARARSLEDHMCAHIS